jgi:hypothetical protein
VLFTHEVEGNTLRLTLEAAVSAGAYLAGAYLAHANLTGANLARTNLAGAYLARTNLTGVNLARTNLARANLAGAYLTGAYLTGAEELVGERPVLQIGPLGSRCAYLIAYLTDKGVRIRAGCWFGARADFESRVIAKYGDNVHGREYRAALALIDAHAELWTPKVDVAEQAA